jgi:15-cis-phytoene synthase
VAPVSRPTSFYYAFLALSRAQREAIVAVWDFCRAVDDTVDEDRHGDPDRVQANLQGWREELARCYGGDPQTPQGRALVPWIQTYQLPRQPFADLIDGLAMDLVHARYETFADLYEYCWRVASTVGFVCLAIFGVRDEGREYALQLGVALQLTNILRDVKTDYQNGRVYLPLEDLRRAGCLETDLGTSGITAPVRDLLRGQAERARAFYARADRARPAGDLPRAAEGHRAARLRHFLRARSREPGTAGRGRTRHLAARPAPSPWCLTSSSSGPASPG